MKMSPGGHWSMSGSYAPVQEGPTGGPACGAPKSFACGGAITREGTPKATLAFLPHGRSLFGNFLGAPSFHERRPNEDQPCSLNDSLVEPMFGLDGCPRDYYTQCSETGSITVKLRFSHPR
jgi:hypothetical protein